MEILQNHGDSEIFYIYQKFIRYCLPDCGGIIFASMKRGRYSQEECLIELFLQGKKITYVLNKKTRLFEEKNKEKQRNVLNNSRDIEENER